MNHYDVIIIGTGAGGGTLAYRLASSGKRILLLERGDWLAREASNWDARAVFVDNRYKAKATWLDHKGKEFHPGIHYYVGGNTKVYGAALLRFRYQDFGEMVHAGGVSPAWPVNYETFEPYYCEAEDLYHVHGQRGIDPTEPITSRPYRYPAVQHEPRIQKLFDDLRKSGHHPFPLPLGLMLDEANPRKSPCIRCSTCDGFPCLVQAKADAATVAVEPALEYSNLTLLTQANVVRLHTGPSGREITGVEVERNGEPETYSADIVVVSAGAINSAALLLRSANEQHPNGLANGSGQVGRNYMCHNNSAYVAISKDANPTGFQKTLGLNDYYFGEKGYEFPMGHIQMLGKSVAEMFEGEAPAFLPGVGLALDQMARHALDFWLTSEDLPDPENRVTLTRDGQIQLHYKENNLEGHQRLTQRLKGLLNKIHCHSHLLPSSLYLGKKIPLAGTAHQCGTVVFGSDPAQAPLDKNCKAHEIDNLYVVDGSFFPSSTAVNPALTIAANALRVGDHLLQRLGAERREPSHA